MTHLPLKGPIRAVTLDLWQTLILDDLKRGQTRKSLRIDGTLRILQESGLPISRTQVSEAYDQCSKEQWDLQALEKDCSFEDQVAIFLRHIRPDLYTQIGQAVRHRLTEQYANPFLSHPPKLVKGARQVLETLRRKNYLVGLISNTGMTPGSMVRDYFHELGIFDYFASLVFSDEVGLSKPAPLIFDHALKELNVNASDTVHVGDNLRSDVMGAKRAGLRAVWIDGYDSRTPEVEPDATISQLVELIDVLP